MRFSTIFAVAFAGLAAAQTSTGSASPQTTVPASSVPDATRATWCRTQQQTCPQLCGGDMVSNTCNSETLEYNCTCNNVPKLNVSDFQQTLPSLECEFAKAQCVTDHPDDADGQKVCQSVTCGNKKVSSQAQASSSSAAASSTTSGSSSSSNTASASSASASATESGNAAVNLAMNYGSSALVAGGFALFGFAL
ncbi:uncharacterized protein K452DRAFT_308836 [Aplosporella prunicola CBS 121167]|uniref:DUF7707 domain-containing protein n=1 Tax=Aplosporella prunicola CBS 121167 TaxID=1176127 RepID=A0A6A6BCB1_9PEZI|nr:uncharacterized protein K452DRAFT_308836 [Aplosporella prunicola CBS 121167]KAF2141770.1 hypothetical protein K452DRAFT_308836 [Aplosporella prunicola CBS 121167]